MTVNDLGDVKNRPFVILITDLSPFFFHVVANGSLAYFLNREASHFRRMAGFRLDQRSELLGGGLSGKSLLFSLSGSSKPAREYKLSGHQFMTTANRYLRFQTIDLDEPAVRASCSQCGKEFVAEPEAGESVEDMLRRTRAQFDSHKCEGS